MGWDGGIFDAEAGTRRSEFATFGVQAGASPARSVESRSRSAGLHDSRARFARGCAFGQPDSPATLAAVDRHGDFGLGRGMVDGAGDNEKVASQVRDGQNVAVEVQLHSHIRGMTAMDRLHGST